MRRQTSFRFKITVRGCSDANINEQRLETLGAAMVTNEKELDVSTELDAELLLVHVQLTLG